MNSKRELAIVIALTALGALLRFYGIDAQSLWFDELLSLTISRLPLQEVIYSPASIDPPLYYVLLHFWLYFGRADGIVRALSVLPAIATIPVIFYLGKKLFDAQVGVVAALLFVLSPFQLVYAHEARMYSWLVLFAALSVLTFLRAQELNRQRDWALWIVAMTLALYTHNFAGLLLIALDLDALMRWRRDQANLRAVVISNLIIDALFLPWFIVLLQKFHWLLPALWIKPPTLFHVISTLYLFIFGHTLPFPINAITLGLVVAVLAFLAIALWHAMRRNVAQEQRALQLLLLASFVPPLLTFLISQWKSVYIDRLLLESAPAFYVLLAWGLMKSDRRAAIRLCAIVALPLTLFAIFNWYANPDYARPPVREAIAFVAARRAPNELVVHTSDSTFLGGRFYDPTGNHILLYHPADQWLIPALMDELRVPYSTDISRLFDEKTFWLVVALDHIPDEQRAEKLYIDRVRLGVQAAEIGTIGVYRYGESGK